MENNKKQNDIIASMLNYQNELNILTSGRKWKNGITMDNKPIYWDYYIFLELGEMLESLNAKHWKNIEDGIDYDNIKIELVDIFHFLLSKVLVKHFNHNTNLNIYIDEIYSAYNLAATVGINEREIVTTLTSTSTELLYSLIKNYDIVVIFTKFFELINLIDSVTNDFKLEDIYKLFLAKYTLNRFRQLNGYKENKYRKIWNGVEDNVYLKDIISETTDVDTILKRLEVLYNQSK